VPSAFTGKVTMSKFRDYNQKQGIFRVIRPHELLGEDHPARIVDIVVENMNLEKLYDMYSDEESPEYHAKMLLKVFFYSYMRGMMSCRKMWNSTL
jgi:transposase